MLIFVYRKAQLTPGTEIPLVTSLSMEASFSCLFAAFSHQKESEKCENMSLLDHGIGDISLLAGWIEPLAWKIQLGLVLRRFVLRRFIFTTLVETERALTTCGASLSQLKRPFST